MHIMLWPQKPGFYIANNYVMNDSLKKIVAASHLLFFQAFYYGMGVLFQKMPDVESIQHHILRVLMIIRILH